MTTVRELLEQRTQELAELLEQIRDETQGDIDLARMTELSDELGGRADDFAQTLTSARETLEGAEDEEAEEGSEKGGEEAAEGGRRAEAAQEMSTEATASTGYTGGQELGEERADGGAASG